MSEGEKNEMRQTCEAVVTVGAETYILVRVWRKCVVYRYSLFSLFTNVQRQCLVASRVDHVMK